MIMRRIGRSRKIRITVLAIIVLALGAGVWWARWHRMQWIAWRALSHADSYELLSLQPQLSGADYFNHEVLGRISITDEATRGKLNRALQSGIRNSDGSMMACFMPRHGIRVTHGNVTTDFVICFECRQVRMWQGGMLVAVFPTTGDPQQVFDQVLRDAGVALAPKEQ